jgi:anti-sigma factor RsiW
MTKCWSEGSLRAYHDGELPPADMQELSAHLAECADCEALADEIAGRALRVADLMSALPEPEQVIWMPRRPVEAPRISTTKRWAAAAVALAASLALVIWLAPRRAAQPAAPVATVDAVPAASVELAPEPVVQPLQPARPAVARIPRRPVRRAQPEQLFFSLDDEPIETGIVVRVALGPAEIPADVVFSADGRARAIRLVSNLSKH